MRWRLCSGAKNQIRTSPGPSDARSRKNHNNRILKVAGFSFIRNSILYDYPILEAIRSVLPVCDLFVVAVGRSDDATLEQVRSIGDPRLVVLETTWDDSLRA